MWTQAVSSKETHVHVNAIHYKRPVPLLFSPVSQLAKLTIVFTLQLCMLHAFIHQKGRLVSAIDEQYYTHSMCLTHRWSLYGRSITRKVYPGGPVKSGHYKQVVFIYRWSLEQVQLYTGELFCDVLHRGISGDDFLQWKPSLGPGYTWMTLAYCVVWMSSVVRSYEEEWTFRFSINKHFILSVLLFFSLCVGKAGMRSRHPMNWTSLPRSTWSMMLPFLPVTWRETAACVRSTSTRSLKDVYICEWQILAILSKSWKNQV